jgi:hypothetical protein
MLPRVDLPANHHLNRANRETAFLRTVLRQQLQLQAQENVEDPDIREIRDGDVEEEEILAQNSA